MMSRIFHRAVAGLLGLAMISAMGSAGAAPQHIVYRGYAFDRDNGNYRFTEVHDEIVDNGRLLSGSVDFFAPDGSLLAHKSLDFSQNSNIPLMHFDQSKPAYSEVISGFDADGIDAQKTEDGKTDHNKIKNRDPSVADAGIYNVINAHFDDLMNDYKVRFHLVVPSELMEFRFRIKKTGERSINGHDAVQFQLAPDSMLRILASPIIMSYDKQTHQLLEYQGQCQLRDPKGGDRFDVRIEYTPTPPPGAPAKLPPLPQP